MKSKIALASAFLAASSFSTAEIVINDFLSFEGFVDMSYSTYQGEVDTNTPVDFDESDNAFGIDQVEISWLFDFDPVTAQVDLEYEEAGDDLEVEQAFVTYHFDNGGAITAGRYASMLGFEAFEPTGLYQYSFAYGLPNVIGDIAGALLPAATGDDDIAALAGTIFQLPGYAQGVKYTYDGDNTFFGLSIQDGTYAYGGRLGGDGFADGTAVDGGGYSVEIAAAYHMDNGLSYFAGFNYEDGDGYSTTNLGTGDTEAWVFNTYVTFETGAWIFAAELNYGENEWDSAGIATLPLLPTADLETESLSGLVMANFAYSEKASVTGRISYVDYEVDADVNGAPVSLSAETEGFKYTLAHSYAFTDNLLLVKELSYTDGDFDTSNNLGVDGDFNELLAAVELIFTF